MNQQLQFEIWQTLKLVGLRLSEFSVILIRKAKINLNFSSDNKVKMISIL